MTTLEKLRAEADRTWAEFQNYKAIVDAELDAARQAVMAKHRARLDSLCAAHDVAQAARLAEADRVALAAATSPHPVGTKLIEWTNWSNGSYPLRTKEFRKTGKTGIIEIWSPGSARPDRMTYGFPAVGRWIVRLLKADGTPSKRFLTLSALSTWLPEGEEPKGKK